VFAITLERFLRRLNSRSVLSGTEQQAILSLPFEGENVRSKSEIVHLGQDIDHASLVIDGIVARFDQDTNGTRQITAFHLSGDMANLGSVVQPQARSALQALSSATVARISHVDLRRLAKRHPAIAEAFWRDCIVDSSILSRWMVNVGIGDARQKVAHLLCELATRYRSDELAQSLSFELHISQAQLGEATSMSAVHVNRTLQSLKDVVTFSRGRIEILDWKRLASIGDFHAEYLQTGVGGDQLPPK